MVTGVITSNFTSAESPEMTQFTGLSGESGVVDNDSSYQLNGISVAEPRPKRSNDNRRSNKPIMEKRRRARINNCLNELKALILDATKKDPRHSKFEKADILEKTVKHLQDLQRQQVILTQATDPTVINKFKAGFAECAAEVGRFSGIDLTVKRRLLQHLNNCLTGVKSGDGSGPCHILPSPPSSPAESTLDQMGGRHPTNSGVQPQPLQILNHVTLSSSGYFMSNGNSGVGAQLIPTKLSNGNIAFIVPSSGLHQFQTTTQATSMGAAHQPSNTPLPMLIPIPNRQQVVPTGAGAAQTSGQLLANSQQVTPSTHGMRTPPSSYSSMSPPNSPQPTPDNGIPGKRPPSSNERCYLDSDESMEIETDSPEPLALVVRRRRRSSSSCCSSSSEVVLDVENDAVDKRGCWRPW